MFAAVDVHYPPSGGARAAVVLASDLAFSTLVCATTEFILVIDGYVTLDPDGGPGLGAYAHAEFGVPVIGVAKTRFASAAHAVPVIRGRARRPLYVTSAGLPPPDAAELVRAMAGEFRLPDALRRVDGLARGHLAPIKGLRS